MKFGKILSNTEDRFTSKVEDYQFNSLQIQELKKNISEAQKARTVKKSKRSISVMSGKGGVGKSNFALNLALMTGSKFKKSSAIIDADLGMANIDVLLGLDTRLNLNHVLRGELTLKEITVPVSDGVLLVPGGSGISELAQMEPETQAKLLPEILSLDNMVDYIIIDTGAGIHSSVQEFAISADTLILVSTPEHTAVKDAYGMIKSLFYRYGSNVMKEKRLYLVVNMAFSKKEALDCSEKLVNACKHFLDLDLNFLGFLSYDIRFSKAVKAKCPLSRLYPNCSTVRKIEKMTSKILFDPSTSFSGGKEPSENSEDACQGTMEKMIGNMFKRLRSR